MVTTWETTLDAKSVFFSIAPEEDTFLGSGPAQKVSAGSESQLEINLLLLRDRTTNETFLFVSVDCLFSGQELRSSLESALKGLVPPDSIFLGASHTHSAPNLDRSKPRLGQVIPSHFQKISETLAERAKNLILSGSFHPVIQKVWRFQSRSVISRRRTVPLTWRGGRLRLLEKELLPNFKNSPEVDSELIEFEGAEGMVGAIWIMPCHPVSVPIERLPSADYVGDIRNYYRREKGNGILTPALIFLQGASGDLRPPSMGLRPWTSWRNVALNFLVGPTFRRFTEPEYELWLSKLRAEFCDTTLLSAKSNSGTERDAASIDTQRKLVPLSRYFTAEDGLRQITLHRVRLGTFVIFGISAEPTWAVRNNLIQDIIGGLDGGSLVGCIDDSFGYLTSPHESRQGGYEVTGFLEFFSLKPMRGRKISSGLNRQVREFLREQKSAPS